MQSKTLRHLLAALLLLLLAAGGSTASASVLVLVHGYLGDGQSFQRAGVIPALEAAGWRYAGDWRAGVDGQPQRVGPDVRGEQVVYTVTLPANAPLVLQADWLTVMRSAAARQHPGQPMTLVGHSAGGVVGRLSIVRGGAGSVTHLITIASPHLGTERAVQALQATDNRGLFAPFRQMVTRQVVGGGNYDAIQHSRAVLVDLAPPTGGNLLGWLNLQDHPDITYDAVVRNTGFRMGGDILVPAWSQDLNYVPALRGRATVIPSPLEHGLDADDARLILERMATRVAAS
jgi:triacylglycerol lipase